MHRVHSFTTALAAAFMAANIAAAQAPRPQEQPKPAQPAGRDAQTSKTGTMTSGDTEFVHKAAAAGHLEVEHGKTAASKASNAQVKAYANTLVKDHTAANQQLMAIAKRKSISIPDQPSHAGGTQKPRSGAGDTHDEPWMSATGAAFDRGFVEAQVKAHQEAIALFEKQANGGSDADLKAFAQKQLPGLRGHLKQAQDLQGKLGTN
jgi:putative membrane protein